jgi:hypothetical protein
MRGLLALLMFALAMPVAASGSIDSLFAAERDFAASSPRLGVKAAFLGVLDEDAVLFRPGPVGARDWYAARPDAAPFMLEWAPEAGEATTDLGYTYGPYRLTPRDAEGRDGAPAGGHFFSIWVRGAGQPWRLLLDQGVSHALVDLPKQATPRGENAAVAAGTHDDLVARDGRLNALLAGAHDAAAMRPYLCADAAVLRSGQRPMSRDHAAALVPMRALARRTHLRLSADGRLAATTGFAEAAPPQTYQRAWRHESGGWCVVVDLAGD